MIQQSTSGYLPEENKTTILKRYLRPHFHCSIIYNSQDKETTKGSIDKWMDKQDVIYTYIHREILFSRKRRKSCHLTTWMDLEGIMLSEISQTERQVLYDLTYMSNQNFFLQTELKDIDWWFWGWGRVGVVNEMGEVVKLQENLLIWVSQI